MSYKLTLYCKTFNRDFVRAKRLLASVTEHNIDDIPFFVSCPLDQKKELEDTLGTEGYTYIADEEIFQLKYITDGWRGQQVIKSNFWKAVETENYICIDSDQYFIKDFFEDDFFHPSGTLYSVIHENKEVQQYEKLLLGKNYRQNGYVKAVKAYRETFSIPNHSKIYDFGPPPYHWCTAVWKDFERRVLDPNELTFETFQLQFEQHYKIPFREAVTYGEYLMGARPIDIFPIAGIFKFYHWKEMYDFEQETGLGLEENVKENYLGITLQSNWS